MNTSLLSYTSVVWKSNTGLNGWRFKCWQYTCLLADSKKDFISWSLEAACISWFMVPLPSFKSTHYGLSIFLYCSNLFCLHLSQCRIPGIKLSLLGPPRVILVFKGQLVDLANSICCLNSPLPCNGPYVLLLDIRHALARGTSILLSQLEVEHCCMCFCTIHISSSVKCSQLLITF